MSIKFCHCHVGSSSSSDAWLSVKREGNCRSKYTGGVFDHLPLYRHFGRKRRRLKLSFMVNHHLNQHGFLQIREDSASFYESRRGCVLPFASADEGVTVNGSLPTSTSSSFEETRNKLDQSMQEEGHSGLVQSLHDAARVIELGIREQSSLSKSSWFSSAWFGVDKTAWVKALSYQAAAYSLLQAASEIACRGDGRDRDVNLFVQRSLLRQSASLESVITEKLSVKLPDDCKLFWANLVPSVASSFVNYFEKDQQFVAATLACEKGVSQIPGSACDVSLLMLALSCQAALMKLGPTKISCTAFFSTIPETIGRLMDMLLEFVSIRQAYRSMKDIGLRREFLVHFGPRAGGCRGNNDGCTEEVKFWVNLVQKQLQKAIDRERIWSRLTTSESIEVLEKDLAIFGFFIALGRSTQSYLSANGFNSSGEPIESIIRYLSCGAVLYYPQLSSISSYQLYVEVVCEELDWLPFYPGTNKVVGRPQGHSKNEDIAQNPEAISVVLDVCSHWIQSFVKHSDWLNKSSNVKAARFLATGHNKLQVCLEELGIQKTQRSLDRGASSTTTMMQKDPDSFDKALESVEGALRRLEILLQELHLSSSDSGKEHLKAACSDLERIRKLKKEAEFLEASFRAKAASLEQGDNAGSSPTKKDVQSAGADVEMGRRASNPRGLWSILVRHSIKSSEPVMSNAEKGPSDSPDSTEVQRFEILRNELMELEQRVQKSADQSQYEEDVVQETGDTSKQGKDAEGGAQLVQVQKENIIGKSMKKLQETSTDVWQGTQLLAIDVAAALGLLRRVVIGDDLTEKEKKALRRTLTDLASVFPIGFLMLLPVTAVGHAAMLAAIQRYVPSLIPSTYGPERLNLLRQLEKVKEMEDELKPFEKEADS